MKVIQSKREEQFS